MIMPIIITSIVLLIMIVLKTQSILLVENCGEVKILRENKGVIQTPNFPNSFEVPIKCKWIIDASLYPDDSKINIYFTQLFVISGFYISDYAYYDIENNFGYSRDTLLNISDNDSLKYELFSTDLHYAVIDFQMDLLQGNHLRVEHKLMNVFGFNITYEITNDTNARPKICGVLGCSMVGHCYANYDLSSYACKCFDGFEGENCGYGPLCQRDKHHCLNGGTCRHAGETNTFCDCLNGYTGTKCEISPNNSTHPVMETDCTYNSPGGGCVLQCPYEDIPGKDNFPCSCNYKIKSTDIPDRSRYWLTYPEEQWKYGKNSTESVLAELRKQIEKMKLKLMTNSRIAQFSEESKYIILEFFIKGNKEIDHQGLCKNLQLYNCSIKQQPILKLTNIETNAKYNSLVEEEEIIISCVAEGSRKMSFTWYKDGNVINVTLALRGMWSKTLPLNRNGTYTGMLSIQKVQIKDGGLYTCKVDDVSISQCRSINLNVVQAPKLKMIPMSISTEKGQNITIRCLSPNEFVDGVKFGYTWLKNDQLIKMQLPNIYWEDLYSGGSILHVNNIQKSDVYRCSVHHIKSRSATVKVDLMDRNSIPYCKNDGIWPSTNPGVKALNECPANYTGDSLSRLCLMTDKDTAQWQLPDYSLCIDHRFTHVVQHFNRVTMGYQNDSVTASNTLKSLRQVLKYKILHPGEGEWIILFLKDVYDFLIQSKNKIDFLNCIYHFYDIIDFILQDTTSILNISALLSDLIQKWTMSSLEQFSNLKKKLEIQSSNNWTYKSFTILPINHYNGRLMDVEGSTSLRINYNKTNGNETNIDDTSAVIIYKHLSNKLLPVHVQDYWENKDILFERISSIVEVISINFKNITSYSIYFKLDSNIIEDRELRCGNVRNFGDNWILSENDEYVKGESSSFVHCIYNTFGLHALFASQMPSDSYSFLNRKYEIIVIMGCSICFIECTIVLCVLIPRWCKIRSCMLYVKIQICASLALSMVLFIYASSKPPKVTYPYLLSGLQVFLLSCNSSHISALIILYVDLLALTNTQHIKPSAISVVTASTIPLAIFSLISSELANEKMDCWWLCIGFTSFYLTLLVSIFVIILFAFLYCIIIKKLNYLSAKSSNEKRKASKMVSYLRCILIIFTFTWFVTLSSVAYVNINNIIIDSTFATSSVILGLVLIIVYIKEEKSYMYSKYDRQYDGISTIPALHVISGRDKHEEDMMDSISSQMGIDDINVIKMTTYNKDSSASILDIPVVTNEKEIDDSIVFHHDLLTGCAEKHEDLESGTPRGSIKNVSEDYEEPIEPDLVKEAAQTSKLLEKPIEVEMLTTKVHLELGLVKNKNNDNNGDNNLVVCTVDVEPCPGHLVQLNEVKFTSIFNNYPVEASIQRVTNNYPVEASIQKVANNYLVEPSIPKITNNYTTEDKVTNNYPAEAKVTNNYPAESSVKTTVSPITTNNEQHPDNNQSDVLEQISHDLDYLLNRNSNDQSTKL